MIGDREFAALEGRDDFPTKPFDRSPGSLLSHLVHQKRLNEDLDHAEQVLDCYAVESRVIPTLAITVNGWYR